MIELPVFDSGLAGEALHYAMILAQVGGAAIAFFILWKTDRLDWGEEPKHTIFMEEDNGRRGD